MKPKVNAVFLGGDDELEHRPWCSRCSRHYKYFDEPKTWSCSGCGDILSRQKARRAKAIDSDTPNPMMANVKYKKDKKRSQDYPAGAQVTEETELNPETSEVTEII